MRFNYEVVKHRAEKSAKCKCGKRLKRSRTFEQTINPFNLMPNGTMKDANDICSELKETAAAWMRHPVTCDECAI